MNGINRELKQVSLAFLVAIFYSGIAYAQTPQWYKGSDPCFSNPRDNDPVYCYLQERTGKVKVDLQMLSRAKGDEVPVIQRLKAIADYLLAMPDVKEPKGHTTFLKASPPADRNDESQVGGAYISYYPFDLMIYKPDQFDDRGETQALRIYANTLPSKIGEMPRWDDEEGTFFMQDKPIAKLSGYDVYRQGMFMTSNNMPLYAPVSKERYYKLMLVRLAEAIDSQVKYLPALKLFKNSQDQINKTQKDIEHLTNIKQLLEQKLQNMGDAKKAPACMPTSFLSKIGHSFVDMYATEVIDVADGAGKCLPLVKMNPDLLKKGTSALPVRVLMFENADIVVRYNQDFPNLHPYLRGGSSALQKLFTQIDLAKIQQIIEK